MRITTLQWHGLCLYPQRRQFCQYPGNFNGSGSQGDAIMHLRDWSATLATLVVGAGLVGWIGQVVGQQPTLQLSAPQNGAIEATGANGGVVEDGTVMTRGPIHEAFAEVINYNPEPTIVVEKRPPDAIEELPPDQKPEGEGHLWIPGYWAWAEDRNDYIWISGVWRAPPPNTQWVPGYWSEVQGGWQWIPGYWQPVSLQPDQDQLAGIEAEEVEYLPKPPNSLEQGPPSPQPSQDHFWVPGHWYWYQARYVWRPGYWAVMVPDWVWVPSRYVWTPNGCVFVPGHWDIVMQRRGLVFAPVYFGPAVYARPRFTYMPRIVLSTNVFSVHLFCRPRYYHYYFGDYYDPGYERYGIIPWFTYHEYRHGYEPCFVYSRWYYHRHHYADWEQRLRRWHNYCVAHVDFRPPHTFIEMRRWADRHRDGPDVVVDNRTVINNTIINNVFATTIEDASQRNDFDIRLVKLDENRRERMVQLGQGFQNVSAQRREIEVRGRDQEPAGERKSPRRVALPGVREMRQVVADATGTAGTPPIQMPSKPPSTVDEARTLRETVLANQRASRGPRSQSPLATERRPQRDSQLVPRIDGTTAGLEPSARDAGLPEVALPEIPNVPDVATSVQSDSSGSEMPERARSETEDPDTRTNASRPWSRARPSTREGQAGQIGTGRTAGPQLPGGIGQAEGSGAGSVAGPGPAESSPAAPEAVRPDIRGRRTGGEGESGTSGPAAFSGLTPDMTNPFPPSGDNALGRSGQTTLPGGSGRPEAPSGGESTTSPAIPGPRLTDAQRTPASTPSGEDVPATRLPASAIPERGGRSNWRDNVLRPYGSDALGGTRRPSLTNRPWATDSSSPSGNPAAAAAPSVENPAPQTRLPEAGSRQLQNRSTLEGAVPAARQPSPATLPNVPSAQPPTDGGRGRSGRETTPRIQQESRSFQGVPQPYQSTPSASSSRRYQTPAQDFRSSARPVAPSRSDARSISPAPRIDRNAERSSGNPFERSGGSSSDRSGGRGNRGRDRGDD